VIWKYAVVSYHDIRPEGLRKTMKISVTDNYWTSRDFKIIMYFRMQRWQVRSPIRAVDFFLSIYVHNLSSHTMALVWTQPLAEITSSNLTVGQSVSGA
jgi:hypothetical protein